MDCGRHDAGAPSVTKRVLSIATLYPNAHTPRFGTFVARSLETLARTSDWQVTVINPLGVPPLALGRYRAIADAAVDGIERGVAVYRPTFPLVPRFGGRINPAVIARKIAPLAKRLHHEKPFDLVDAQFFYPDGPAAASIAKALDLPLSIKARGSDISYWGKRDFALSKMLHAAREASGLLAVSQALADDMAGLGFPANKIEVHYTGLDRDRFRPLAHVGLRKRVGEALGIALPECNPVLTCTGALIERKGQRLVIEAVAQLPDAHLILVGTGPDEAALREQTNRLGLMQRVHFVGSVDHDLLPLILSASDAMVLPSASEGLANAWVEALACGTPLVITDVGGARELVRDPVAGTMVARDANAIADGIRHVIAQPRSPEDVAATVAQFDWAAHAARLADYYDRLIYRA